jgi:starch-binding outer membrane protein, SusD/RagB family
MKKYTKVLMGMMVALSVLTPSCKKDFTNPNAATDEQVFSSPRGLTGVAISLQRIYALGRTSTVYNMVTANGFVTNELFLVNPGNLPEAQLDLGGGNVDPTNTILGWIWSNASKILYDGDKVIAGAEQLADKNYASGLIGYTTIFKALSLGSLAMYWEKVPDGVGQNITFSDRSQGYSRAIAAIDKALGVINANPISTTFTANIPAGIDIVNTLNALKARYYLNLGNYPAAIAAANAVDLSKKSVFSYDALNLNPIFETSTATNNVFQPKDSTMGLPVALQPNLADKRIPFYMSINPTIAPRFRIAGFGASAVTPFPVYLPDEMRLIRAEAFVKQSSPDFAAAKAELDAVIRQAPAADPFGVGADIAAGYTGALDANSLLGEIYRQRSIELYMSGLRLEDMRRLGRPLSERKRNFFPYPFRERDNNKANTPPDPTF